MRRKSGFRARKRSEAPVETPAAEARPAESAPAPQSAPAAQPTREAIAQLAYSYWQERGFAGGSEEEDWLRAERELKTRGDA